MKNSFLIRIVYKVFDKGRRLFLHQPTQKYKLNSKV